MLQTIEPLLQWALKENCAVAAFNTYNYASIAAAVQAAERTNIPVIIAFGENAQSVMSIEVVVGTVRTLSENASVPIALHLDHASSFDVIIQAIRAGFTSVMYDGSMQPFEVNVTNTRRVVEIAHSVGITVEAELGGIAAGLDTDERDAEQTLTDPELALEFCKRTEVDALAVSVGTVHGLYRGEPQIDISRLKRIHSLVDTPLVLHGGSGTPKSILQETIKSGVCKVNINTQVSKKAVAALSDHLKNNPGAHLSHLTNLVKQTMTDEMVRNIELLCPQRDGHWDDRSIVD